MTVSRGEDNELLSAQTLDFGLRMQRVPSDDDRRAIGSATTWLGDTSCKVTVLGEAEELG